jgi:hypothetical protein
MTITSITRRAGPFAGNGVATLFTFNFKVFTTADVVVTLAELATGIETTLVLDTHYTVALNPDQNLNPGGTVTYPISGSPMASTHTLTLTSGVTQLQETDIVNQGGFFPEVIENSLDKQTILTQQETERVNRAIVLPVSDNNPVVTLPTAAVRASKLLGFDSSGNPVATTPSTPGALMVSSFIETLLDDANAKAARQTLALDKKGADIASAGTIVLNTTDGDLHDLTGATTVTAITLDEGVKKKLRIVTGLQFTHGASLILPDGINLITFAGDIVEFTGFASGVVRLTGYLPIGAPNEADVAQDDIVRLYDASAAKGIRAIVQNMFNSIGGMTAHSGVVDIDADKLVVYDASQSAPKQRILPARIGQVPARQTALIGSTDANGYANFLTTGSGLRPGLLATATPLVLTSAAGFDEHGEKNYLERFTADVSDIFGFDAIANVTNYAYRTLGSGWDRAAVPPQYGYAFDRTQNALLNFNGADTSTSIIDDFGNTWTAAGNAQLDTAQQKFGSASLLLDGTGDYVESTDFKTLGGDSWEISSWFRLNTTSALHTIVNAGVAAGFGVILYVDHNAGNRRLRLDLSSNGSSADIASSTGATTTIALSTWYKVRITFDALAGTYRVYLSNNGASETQEISVSSTSRICALLAGIRLGAQLSGANFFNGWLDAFRFVRAVVSTATVTPPASEPVVTDFPVHFFSIPKMQMFEVTAASVSAGTDPAFTARNRVFVGEFDCDASSITAVRTYALRGEWSSGWIFVASTPVNISHNHNIGLPPTVVDKLFRMARNLGNHRIDDIVHAIPYVVETGGIGYGFPLWKGTRTVIAGRMGSVVMQWLDDTGTARSEPSGSNGIGYLLTVKRGW